MDDVPIVRSSPAEVKKYALKICSKFTGEHPCQSTISIKLQSNFIEIILRHGCSLVNLLHIFRTFFFCKNSYGGLLLENDAKYCSSFAKDHSPSQWLGGSCLEINCYKKSGKRSLQFCVLRIQV